MFYRWSYPDDAPLPLEAILAFLRLGRKYAMKPLYDNALARITTVAPSSVDDYIRAPMNAKVLFKDPANDERRQEIVFHTIAIGRELDLPYLLPAAFWFLSSKPDRLADDAANLLLPPDKKAILLATERLRVAYADCLFGWLDESVISSPDCSTPKTCRTTKTRYSLKVWRPPGLPLRFSWRTEAEKGLCSSCITVAKKRHRDGRQRLWKELPSFFDLPPWEELLAW